MGVVIHFRNEKKERGVLNGELTEKGATQEVTQNTQKERARHDPRGTYAGERNKTAGYKSAAIFPRQPSWKKL